MNWSQLKTILWLRWRLMRNQFYRRGELNIVLTILIAVIGTVASVGGLLGGFLIGGWLLPKASPVLLMFVWDLVIVVFLFFWMIGIVREVQRAEAIDIHRLLHLPVSLKQIFLLNYIASYFNFDLLILVPGMVGLILGLMWGKSVLMIWLAPLVFSFLFMISAWTYCLRGWLVALMSNPRRRRTIIVAMTAAIVLITQVPNLYLNVFNRQKYHPRKTTTQPKSKPQDLWTQLEEQLAVPSYLSAHKYVPPLWVGGGAGALARGDAWPALGASLASLGIGFLGLARAYQSTRRYYFGRAVEGAPQAAAPEAEVHVTRKNFLEGDLPWAPKPAIPVSLAFFRSISRAPEVKMALFGNIIMLVVFAGLFLSKTWTISSGRWGAFIATAAMALSTFGLTQLMLNQFGIDRSGFRSLVLLPTERKYILLGKNMAFLPIALGMGALFLVFLHFILHLTLLTFLATCLQLFEIFLLLCALGNLVSILVPYRISAGSLKPTKVPPKVTVILFLSHMFFPVALFPAILGPALGLLSTYFGWMRGDIVNLLVSLLLTAVVAAFYWKSLGWLGRLLQKREQEILQAVVVEAE